MFSGSTLGIDESEITTLMSLSRSRDGPFLPSIILTRLVATDYGIALAISGAANPRL